MFGKKKQNENEEWIEEQPKTDIPVKKLKEDRITVSELEKKPFFLYGVIFIAFLFVLALFPILKKEEKLKEPVTSEPVPEIKEPVAQERSYVCIKNQTTIDLVTDSTIVLYYKNNKLTKVNVNKTYTIQSENQEEIETIKLQDQNMDLILNEKTGYTSNISETSTNYIFDYTIDLSKLDIKLINESLSVDEQIDFPYTYNQNIETTKNNLIKEGYICY